MVFEKEQVERALSAAATEVLETMFFASVDEADGTAARGVGDERIGVQIAFQGACCGCLSLSLEAQAVQSLAAGFLGEEQEPQQEESGAVMAELANMVCGALLSRLARKAIFRLDRPVLLASPAVGRGWIEKELLLDEGLLRLAFSFDHTAVSG